MFRARTEAHRHCSLRTNVPALHPMWHPYCLIGVNHALSPFHQGMHIASGNDRCLRCILLWCIRSCICANAASEPTRNDGIDSKGCFCTS